MPFGILDTRTLYPDSSLADLYDTPTMPPELRKAHEANDRAVEKAYGRNCRVSDGGGWGKIKHQNPIRTTFFVYNQFTTQPQKATKAISFKNKSH